MTLRFWSPPAARSWGDICALWVPVCLCIAVCVGCGFTDDITPDIYDTSMKKCSQFGGIDHVTIYRTSIWAYCKDGTRVSWDRK